MKCSVWLCCVSLTLFYISCASLSEGGKKVQYLTKQEAGPEYELIGEVNVGQGLMSMGAFSVEDVKIKMRNQTAEMGGDLLVIDTIESHNNPDGSRRYSGTGRAYKKKTS